MSSAPRLDTATETFIQGAGKVSAALLGMVNKVGGQIYALLFLSPEPLSLDDIAERLQISKGNVSINVRMLEDYKLVRKIWMKGSRRDYYAAEITYPKKVIRDFLDKIRQTIEDAKSAIHETKVAVDQVYPGLAKDQTERADFMLAQLRLIELFYQAAAAFFSDFYAGKPVNLDLLRTALEPPNNSV